MCGGLGLSHLPKESFAVTADVDEIRIDLPQAIVLLQLKECVPPFGLLSLNRCTLKRVSSDCTNLSMLIDLRNGEVKLAQAFPHSSLTLNNSLKCLVCLSDL